MVIKTLLVKTTKRCNLKCTYCYIPNKENQDISIETINNLYKFSRYLFGCSQEKLDIHLSGGEITLLPIQKIELLFSMLQGKNIKLHMNTNSRNFNIEHIKLCKKYCVKVCLSLDGSKEHHEKQRGIGNFDEVMNARKLCQENNVDYGFICVLQNDSNIVEISSFFRNLGESPKMNPGISLIDPKIWCEQMKKCTIKESNNNDVIDVLKRNKPHCTECSRYNCFSNFIAVDPSGDVTTCERFFGLLDYKKYLIGNINIDNPIDLIFGEKRTKLLNQLYTRKEKCFNCRFYNVCGSGCSHASILYNGDIESKDPFCESKKELYKYILGETW